MNIRNVINLIGGFSLLMMFGCDSTYKNELYYEQSGNGETIVFIHGTQEDYRVFMPQLDLLDNDYNVISYSRRYNYPKANIYQKGIPFSTETEAKDLEVLLNSLNVKSVHIVAHSYGGLVAMQYTHDHPDRVQSLTLSEPPLLRLPGCARWYQAAQEELVENVGVAFETNDTTRVLKAIFEFFAGADIQDQVPTEVLQSLKANLSEMRALVNSRNPFPDLSTDFAMPVMLITAENTLPMLQCTNEALVRKIPTAKHIHLSDASHDMWMTHPEILSKHVRDFLSGIPKGNNR